MNIKQKIFIHLLCVLSFIVGIFILLHAGGFASFVLSLCLISPLVINILIKLFYKPAEDDDDYD